MFFALNSFGDLIIFFVVVAFVLIVTRDNDKSKGSGDGWDHWHKNK